MLFSLLSGGSLTDIIVSFLLSMPIIIIALVVHETAHGYIAMKCGDYTAYNMGRLTLDPRKHLDPIGLLCMLVFGFGWAKPVPINSRNFRDPKKGMALSAAAGPGANLLLGVISCVFYALFAALYNLVYLEMGEGFFLTAINYVVILCYLGALYNFLFMVFNLIPIPPFDGSRIALFFLPEKIYFGIMRYERQIMFGLLIALLILSRFGASPFSMAAEGLTDLISDPLYKLFNKLFLPEHIYNIFFH